MAADLWPQARDGGETRRVELRECLLEAQAERVKHVATLHLHQILETCNTTSVNYTGAIAARTLYAGEQCA